MPSLISLSDIAEHHVDASASFTLYFSNVNPAYPQRFTGYLPSEIANELGERISESDMRSSLVTLARVEAALRRDYRHRSQNKLSDNVSIEFRRIFKRAGDRARLDDDILSTWYANVDPPTRALISKFRGMLKFRHWLAHGRHWNTSTKYSFQDVYLVADLLNSRLPLLG